MRQGFVREEQEIKYLILFCMTFLPFAVSESDLLDIVLIDDGFGYFEFKQALDHLVENRLVAQVAAGQEIQYALTPKGAALVPAAGEELRSSVRDKAEQAALRVVRKIRRSTSLRAEHAENADGSYTVCLQINDNELQLAKIELMVVTKRQCQMLEESFKQNAEEIYKELLTLLMDGERNHNA